MHTNRTGQQIFIISSASQDIEFPYILSTMLVQNLESNLSLHVTIYKYSACKTVKLQYFENFPRI